MTVTAVGFSGPTWVQLPGNGAATVYSFPFLISANTDIAVGFIAGGTYTLQITGYTVQGVGNVGGGSVTFATAPSLGTTVDLRSQIPETQPTNFANLGGYYPESTTNAVDRVTRLVTDMYRLAYLFSIHGPDTENVPWTPLPGPSGRAGGTIVFDANGLPTIGILTATALTQALFNSFLLTAPTGGVLTPAESAAGISVITNATYVPGVFDRYGSNAIPGSSNMTAAIQAALNQGAQPGGAPAIGLAQSTYLFTSTLTVAAKQVLAGTDTYTTILKKSGNFVGISVTSLAQLRDFTLISTTGLGDVSDGIQVNTNGRVHFERLQVGSDVVGSGHGGHGLNLIQCDTSNFIDISCVNNTQDGLHLTGAVGVGVNANNFNNIDSRGNGGWGLNCLFANANFGMGIAVQSNLAGGIQFDTCFSNCFQVYAESNTGPSVNFTANCVAPNYGGNVVNLVLSDTAPTFNSTSSLVNMVIRNKAGATYQTNYSQLIADSLVFDNVRIDGTQPAGVFTVSHTSANELDFIASGTSANVLTKFANSTGGFYHYLQTDGIWVDQPAVNVGAGTLSIGSSTATTASAGGAPALPGPPAGYLICNLGGSIIKLPYWPN